MPRQPVQSVENSFVKGLITEATGIGDFDLAFAYEALARAYSIAGKKSECKKYLQLSQKAIDDIKGQEDRKICQSELDKVKCI